MKTSITSAAAITSTFVAASVSAFTPAATYNTRVIGSSSELHAATGDDDKSKALPFAPRPKLLDGSLPGDAGFDPFGLAGDDKESLIYRREAEIKHGRLAMLAAAGWPLAELWDKSIASAIGLPTALTSTGSSPSPLNGGLDQIKVEYWVIVACLAGIIEIDAKATKDEKGKDYVLGDCGFDPLNLFPEDKAQQFEMQTKELKHGRIAMMAVLGYAIQEGLYRIPVVDETPFFFKPLGGLF